MRGWSDFCVGGRVWRGGVFFAIGSGAGLDEACIDGGVGDGRLIIVGVEGCDGSLEEVGVVAIGEGGFEMCSAGLISEEGGVEDGFGEDDHVAEGACE